MRKRLIITGSPRTATTLYLSTDPISTLHPSPSLVADMGHIPVKTLRGVHGSALNAVWESVGLIIADLMLIRKVACSFIGVARFFTHATPGEEGKGHLGPVVVWLGVAPGSTSSDFAHEVSQEILTLLRDSGVKDVVVEWRESVLQRLGGPPLLGHVGSTNPTYHLRRFLTSLLGVPLATQGMEKEDSQGTLTLWFHENRNKNGDLSNKVYGVSNCHVRTPLSTTSTNAAQPGSSFEFADFVDSSRGLTRSSSISVTMPFAQAFTLKRSMDWRRRMRTILRTRSPRIEPSWTPRTMLSASSKTCTLK
jgi:hypothetical protein